MGLRTGDPQTPRQASPPQYTDRSSYASPRQVVSGMELHTAFERRPNIGTAYDMPWDW